MRESGRGHIFVIGKLVGLVFLLGYEATNSRSAVIMKAFCGMLMAFFVAAAVLLEMTEQKKIKLIEWILEGILAITGVFLFPVSGCLFGVIWIADFCSLFRLQGQWFLLTYLMLPLFVSFTGYGALGFLIISFITILYLQEKIIVEGYRSDLGLEEETQNELKNDIEKQNRYHQKEMQRSRLKFENEMLEERNRISQALHDKLGHSINGSIYQLEATKLLLEKQPGECERILQAVIDQLRQSMDEIRAILRRERPGKKRMAFLALQALCEECESQYRIRTKLNIEDEEGLISEKNWEIILDNTYEAVTNALKYSGCHQIFIDIIAMNEVVRCTIRDDGKGAESYEDGMGITGMKDRVRSVKGYIGIESEAGFTINMVLPMRDQ